VRWTLDRARFEEWKTHYYGLEGWDKSSGWPTTGTLGHLGLAVLGAIMANRFAAVVGETLPAAVREALPPDALAQLTSNPQALTYPDVLAALQEMLGQSGSQGAALVEQLMQSLQDSLANALSDVFLFAFAAVVVGFVLTLFLSEVPLRKTYQFDEDDAGSL